MTWKSKRKSARRGVSMMEVVVAIAVISIVTVASVTLATQSVRVERDSVRNWEIAIHAENALECYRYSGGNGLLDLLQKEDAWTQEGNVYTLEKSDYIITIKITDSQNQEFALNAVSKDGKEIYSLTAPKNP